MEGLDKFKKAFEAFWKTHHSVNILLADQKDTCQEQS